MKKAIIILLAIAVTFAMSGVTVLADSGAGSSSNGAISELTKDNSCGGGDDPIEVKAKWEMRAHRTGDPDYSRVGYWTDGAAYDNWWYEDDHTTQGAQFMPSGDETVNTSIMVCGVVAHPDLEDNPSGFSVSADIYYPNVKGIIKDFCHARIDTIILNRLNRNPGLKLVCGRTGADLSTGDDVYSTSHGIKNLDHDLPTPVPTDGYYDICHELEQEEAYVFCGDFTISYEAPEGGYEVEPNANGPNGLYEHLTNTFDYLPLKAFKIDFTGVDYGNVSLREPTLSANSSGSHVGGDTDMSTDDEPTIQGTGNTVLKITVSQDDMGFKDTSGVWNVKYRTRLSSLPGWTNGMYYYPDKNTYPGLVPKITPEDPDYYTMTRYLGLSEIQKLDFQVYVENFPSWHDDGDPYTADVYSGNITLTAVRVPLESCTE